MNIKLKIEKANEEAAQRMIAGLPVLVDIAPAREVVPGIQDHMIMHSGPPIQWVGHAGRTDQHGFRHPAAIRHGVGDAGGADHHRLVYPAAIRDRQRQP